MRDLKAPWYVNVTANDDVEIRNNEGAIVFTYYYSEDDRARKEKEFPGADIDVMCGGAEALELLRERTTGPDAPYDWEERVRKLLEKVDKRDF